MIELSCDRALVTQFADGEAGQYDIMKQNEADGVTTMEWPQEMLDAFSTSWDKVLKQETEQNADSARVWESLAAFREDYKVWGERAYLK